jgi:hypothetical protein
MCSNHPCEGVIATLGCAPRATLKTEDHHCLNTPRIRRKVPSGEQAYEHLRRLLPFRFSRFSLLPSSLIWPRERCFITSGPGPTSQVL